MQPAGMLMQCNMQHDVEQIEEEHDLWHADGELLYSLVDLLDQLISHLLHDQNHLDCCTPLPTVAEPALHARCVVIHQNKNDL